MTPRIRTQLLKGCYIIETVYPCAWGSREKGQLYRVQWQKTSPKPSLAPLDIFNIVTSRTYAFALLQNARLGSFLKCSHFFELPSEIKLGIAQILLNNLFENDLIGMEHLSRN